MGIDPPDDCGVVWVWFDEWFVDIEEGLMIAVKNAKAESQRQITTKELLAKIDY